MVPRGSRAWRQLGFLAYGGMLGFAQLPELVITALSTGFGNAFRGSLASLVQDINAVKLAAREANQWLGPSEVMLNARLLGENDIRDAYRPRTMVERGLSRAVHTYSLLNLMAPANDMLRSVSSLSYNHQIIEAGVRLIKGQKLKKNELLRIQQTGLDEADLIGIAKQWDKFGEVNGQKHMFAPNANAWDDQVLREKFSLAHILNYDINVIKSGTLSRPKVPLVGVPRAAGSLVVQRGPGDVADQAWRVVTFFRNWTLAAHGRILGRSLQYRDATVLANAVTSLGMGMMYIYFRRAAAGDDQHTDVDELLRESIERSGLLGTIFETDSILENATSGKLGLSALMNPDQARYYDGKTMMQAIFGPLAGGGMDFARASAGLLTGDAEERERAVRRFRRIAPFNNFWLLNNLIRALGTEDENR